MARRNDDERVVVRWLYQQRGYSIADIERITGLERRFIARWKDREEISDMSRGPPKNKKLKPEFVKAVTHKAETAKFQNTRVLGSFFIVMFYFVRCTIWSFTRNYP